MQNVESEVFDIFSLLGSFKEYAVLSWKGEGILLYWMCVIDRTMVVTRCYVLAPNCDET